MPAGAAPDARHAARGHGAEGRAPDGPARGLHAHVPPALRRARAARGAAAARAAATAASSSTRGTTTSRRSASPTTGSTSRAQTQTNALMVAAFERLGVALCDRAVEHDLEGAGTPPLAKDRARLRVRAARRARSRPRRSRRGFDVAPPHVPRLSRGARAAGARERASSRSTRTRRAPRRAARPSRASRPAEAGWAAVCYGLVRHPEFHLY